MIDETLEIASDGGALRRWLERIQVRAWDLETDPNRDPADVKRLAEECIRLNLACRIMRGVCSEIMAGQ
jgi:hypothetical protein